MSHANSEGKGQVCVDVRVCAYKHNSFKICPLCKVTSNPDRCHTDPKVHSMKYDQGASGRT